MADGVEDANERGLHGDLLRGGQTRSMLAIDDLESFGAASHLAYEVLHFDDPAVLEHLESNSEVVEPSECRQVLEDWIAESPAGDIRIDRSRQALGLQLEVLNFGLLVAKASGDEIGPNASDEELEWWYRVARDLGVPHDKADAVLTIVGR
jgi:hypothetical protein